MKIGRPVGASGELIRSLSRNAKWEFGVQGATMWVSYKAPKQIHKQTSPIVSPNSSPHFWSGPSFPLSPLSPGREGLWEGAHHTLEPYPRIRVDFSTCPRSRFWGPDSKKSRIHSGLFRGAPPKSETPLANQLLVLFQKCGLSFSGRSSKHHAESPSSILLHPRKYRLFKCRGFSVHPFYGRARC